MKRRDFRTTFQKICSVKRITFCTLFAVVILHLLSTLPGLNSSLKEYQLAQQIHYLNFVSDDLFTAVGNFGFERGRVNVVLNDSGPVEQMESNRQFILARRTEGDQALARALVRLRAKPSENHTSYINAINQLTKRISSLREEAAAYLVVPKQKRKPQFAETWFSAMTQYIESIDALWVAISSDISNADGLISRYSSIKHEILALRNTAGPEMSILSAAMLSGKPLKPQLAEKIRHLHMSSKHHLQSLTYFSQALPSQEIPQALEELKKVYLEEYWPYREEIFPLALKGGPYPYSQVEFLGHGGAVLHKVAAFMDTVVKVTKEYADEQLAESKKQATFLLADTIGSMVIIVLIFLYVQFRIIRPITMVTSSLQRLAQKDLTVEVPFLDVQDELGTMARAVEIFRQMAIKLDEEMISLKLAEQKIKMSEERFRTVADFAYDWEYWIDPEGKLKYISPSCERITGYSTEEFLQDHRLLTKICSRKDFEVIERHICVERLEKEPATTLDYRIHTKEGEVRWINHICQPIVGTDGTFLGRRACNRDITDRKKLEEELITAKKLEATAILAGGIAHDFNNLLMAILGNIELAEEMFGPNDKGHGFLQAAKAASFRARDLTAKFITFSSGGEPVKQQTDINQFVETNTSLLLSGTNVCLETILPPDSWRVELDQSQVSQVISNIVTNIKECLPEGGHLKLSIENLDSIASEKISKSVAVDKRYVKLSFQDDGPGISQENIGKVFDPYFTTKDMGAQKGMGLGLTIAHSIISKHDGYTTIQSSAKGTTINLYLPASSPHLQSSDDHIHSIDTRKSTEKNSKILFMDDEEMLRNFVSTLLNNEEFNCETAQDGHEAIEKYRAAKSSGQPFDIAIFDLTIPGGMGGANAVKELLKMDPQAKVIVASGYSSDPVMEDYRRYGFCGAIAKPFQSNDLLHLLRRL